MSTGFTAYPIAAAAAGTAEIALAAAGVLTALAAPFFILWLEDGKHHAHSGVQSSRRDITDVPDGKHDPDDPPETVYHYTGNHVSDSNEIGYGHREKKYIAYSFQTWAAHMYGQRYKFLTGVALSVARRRYRKWRRNFPNEPYTPLHVQVREEVMRPFESPRRKRRHYTRDQLYAL